MGKRTYESDIIAMALLYRKEYVGTDMISYDKAVKFNSVINNNLDNMNANCGIGIRYEEQSRLYFIMQDENGRRLAVINPNADLKKAWEYHIGCLPIEVCIASQMDNALREIGLIIVDGKMRDRNLYYNELRKKYNLVTEYQQQKFDVFKDWESVPEDGFVEKFCISDAEQFILRELRENKKQNEEVEKQEIDVLKRTKKI